MRFVVATHNRKKREELSRILSVLDIVAVTGEEVGVSLTEPEETGTTFEENAWIKAAAACRETGLPAVADDSGLMVDALDGAPGVYSARYAGEGERRGPERQTAGSAQGGAGGTAHRPLRLGDLLRFSRREPGDRAGGMPRPDRLRPAGGRRLRVRSPVHRGRWAPRGGPDLRRADGGRKGRDQSPWQCPAGVFRRAAGQTRSVNDM